MPENSTEPVDPWSPLVATVNLTRKLNVPEKTSDLLHVRTDGQVRKSRARVAEFSKIEVDWKVMDERLEHEIADAAELESFGKLAKVGSASKIARLTGGSVERITYQLNRLAKIEAGEKDPGPPPAETKPAGTVPSVE